jgi:hypothetical protein
MTEMKRSVQKQPVCTGIEVNSEVHKFVVSYQNHRQIIEIHAGLERDYQGWCMMQGMCQKCYEMCAAGCGARRRKGVPLV